LENLPDLICIVDDKGVIRYANNATELLLEYSPDEMIGKCISDLIENYSYSRIGEILSSSSNSDVHITKESWKDAKGDFVLLESKTKSISKAEEQKLFVMDCRDIRERSVKENEARMRLTELQHYIFAAAHDIRVPVTSILGLLDLMARAPENSDKCLELIKNSARRLNEEVALFRDKVLREF
jgi:PAS domain S-box-containing protein